MAFIRDMKPDITADIAAEDKRPDDRPRLYRVRPYEVRVMRLTGSNARRVENWVISKGGTIASRSYDGNVVIETSNTVQTAMEGDYIVQDITSTFSVWEPDRFAATFETVAL